MSYHLGRYGQADWFFDTKPKYEAPAPTGQVVGLPEKLAHQAADSPPAPSAPPPASPPASPPPTSSAEASAPPPEASAPSPAPAPPEVYDDDEGGLSWTLIAGVGALALAAIFIYFKFSGGSEEEVIAVSEKEAPVEKPKTIKIELEG